MERPLVEALAYRSHPIPRTAAAVERLVLRVRFVCWASARRPVAWATANATAAATMYSARAHTVVGVAVTVGRSNPARREPVWTPAPAVKSAAEELVLTQPSTAHTAVDAFKPARAAWSAAKEPVSPTNLAKGADSVFNGAVKPA